MRRTFLFFILLLMLTFKIDGDVISPAPLKEGDKIAILSPAGIVKQEFVDSAAETLRKLGFEPVVYPTVELKDGQFSGTKSERFKDLKCAFEDPEIRAILCTRGGYGAVHLLDSLSVLPIEKDPKWVIGYSDISALHALMASKNIKSIHSSMARVLAEGEENEENIKLIDILRGKPLEYFIESHPYNHSGVAKGKLLGGNLSVIQALIDTPFDIIKSQSILFIEDVNEPIYKIERILYQLKLSGVLENLKGLIIGQFSKYEPNENYETMEDMINDLLKDYPELPVAFDFPIGHFSGNIPVIESAEVELNVAPEGVNLKFTK